MGRGLYQFHHFTRREKLTGRFFPGMRQTPLSIRLPGCTIDLSRFASAVV
jgi:hypothetical protein